MEAALALLIGLFIAVAIYLILSRALIRVVIGIVVLGNAINLLIFVAGRLTSATPPIVPPGMDAALGMANPLPQALILTAIVIGFAMFAYFIVLALRAYQATDADDINHMRLAEPEGEPRPPLEY
ncbi:MAG: Na+/H+ antiporter subunit C [Hyphomicrobiales bacterium]|nr:MAG: Na+/H+ antiporter subunit C [Hyphomicrobiales bacterium]